MRNSAPLSYVTQGDGVPPGGYVASGYSAYEAENEHLQDGLKKKVEALKHVSNAAIYVAGTCIDGMPSNLLPSVRVLS